MPSVTFFALLREGARQQAEDWRLEATMSMAPEMKPKNWEKFILEIEEMTRDADTIVVSDINKLKEIFGQK